MRQRNREWPGRSRGGPREWKENITTVRISLSLSLSRRDWTQAGLDWAGLVDGQDRAGQSRVEYLGRETAWAEGKEWRGGGEGQVPTLGKVNQSMIDLENSTGQDKVQGSPDQDGQSRVFCAMGKVGR